MTEDQVRELQPGIYHIRWKSGGGSVASLFWDREGNPQIAPTNWVEQSRLGNPRKWWVDVEFMEFLTDQERENKERGLV